ncbi:MAG: hypothetical protein ABIJ82_04035 [Patescibacteria group bacterium]
MDDNTQKTIVDDQVQGDPSQGDQAAPATPVAPAAPVSPAVEEPGVEGAVPTQVSPDGETEEEESFEDSDNTDTAQTQ